MGINGLKSEPVSFHNETAVSAQEGFFHFTADDRKAKNINILFTEECGVAGRQDAFSTSCSTARGWLGPAA